MSDSDNRSFARLYRPKNIDEYMGQSMRSILRNRFSDPKNFPQVILLHGIRGTGKTSAARIIAKEYHCLNRVNGHACGECEMCQEIENNLISSEAGVTALGVQEVDIASESGKADIENILEEALEEPMYPLVYKVLILDEFHEATRQAQNRLLKILEEPPKHLVFILCTTNPEKIIDTIVSRCQLKIEVRKADVEELANRLLYVCKQESIKTSMEALRVIAKKSNRVPREALMLLESVAKNFNYEVTVANVQKEIGDVASEVYIEYINAANKSLEDIMKFTKQLVERNITYKKFISGLTEFILDSLYIKFGMELENYPLEYVKAVKKLFSKYNTKDFDVLLQIIEYASNEINSDDTKSKLTIINTAMRIGKIGLLNESLGTQATEAVKENHKAMLEYKKTIDKEAKERKVEVVKADDAMLATVFGNEVVGITSTINTENVDSKEVVDSDDRALTEEELMSIFNNFSK